MLKFLFFLLLAANALMLAIGQGVVGHFADGEREPARLTNQLNARALTLVPAAQASATAADAAPQAAASAAVPALAPAAARNQAVIAACLEAGDFMPADARRFETELDALALGDRQSRRNVPGQEVSSYVVNIPPFPTREAANRKAADLRAKGVTNFYIMPDTSPQRLAISLGVFKQEAAAQTALAGLLKQGVTGARITPRYAPSKLLAFQFREISAGNRTRLEKIVAGFQGQKLRKCQ
jgi:hypothetical protein